MAESCPVCFDTGFVCEAHPHRAWHFHFGCTCSARVPCWCQKPKEEPVSSFPRLACLHDPEML
jgi:hypothetical protein